MNYEELYLTGFIHEMADVSSGPHSRKFCFVLGAGASRTSGIKSGQELVNIWDKELKERNLDEYQRWKQEFGITDENRYGFYSKYYEKRFAREPSDGYNYLEKLMEHARPSTGYVMLSYLLTQTSHNVVITTNFDHMVEDAVNYYAQNIPLVVGHEALAHYISQQAARPTVIKIHRDLLFDPKNSTKEVGELHKNWENALDYVFSRYHPIFIGYAGNDESLMGFLTANGQKFQDKTWKYPYWMLYGTDPLEGQILEFLEKAGGYFVRHNGFDETLYLMGDALGYKVPTKERFLANAEERYQMLTDSIDAFTAKEKQSREESEPLRTPDTPEPDVEETSISMEETPISEAIRRVTGQSEQQKLYSESISLYDVNKFTEAAEIQNKLVQENPENARYHYSYGRTLHKMSCFDAAAAEMQRAIEREPGQALYHWNLGYILRDIEDRLEEALSAMQEAIDIDPEDGFYHSQASIVLLQMGRNEEALKEVQTAIALEPDHAFYYDNLGDVYGELGPEQALLEARQKAIELQPDEAWYYFKYGKCLFDLGRYAQAHDQVQKAVELEPGDKFYHRYFGKVLEAMGRHEEAASERRKANVPQAASRG